MEDYDTELGTEEALSNDLFEALRKAQREGQYSDELKDKELVQEKENDVEVDFGILEKEWLELWEHEADELRVPDNFSGFLQAYIESYLEREKGASIYRMLKTDFLHGLILQDHRTGLPPSLKELLTELEGSYSSNHYISDHIMNGLNHTK